MDTMLRPAPPPPAPLAVLADGLGLLGDAQGPVSVTGVTLDTVCPAASCTT